MLEINSFVLTLIGLCAFTILFGRYFCGYVCAFGTLEDYIFACAEWIRSRVLHLKKTRKRHEKLNGQHRN